MKPKKRIPKFRSEAEERRAKLRTLLEAGYAELGSEAKRLEREFAHLDVESLRHIRQLEAGGDQAICISLCLTL